VRDNVPYAFARKESVQQPYDGALHRRRMRRELLVASTIRTFPEKIAAIRRNMQSRSWMDNKIVGNCHRGKGCGLWFEGCFDTVPAEVFESFALEVGIG
jgi:hypothetical protein